MCHRMVLELAAASEMLLLEQHNLPLALDAMTTALRCIDLETRIADQKRAFEEVSVNIDQGSQHVISVFLTQLVLSQQDQVAQILQSIRQCREEQENENRPEKAAATIDSRRPKILRSSQCNHLLETNRSDWACSMSCVVLYNIGVAYSIIHEYNSVHSNQTNAALQSYQAALGASSLIIDSSQSHLMKCQTLQRIEELVGHMDQQDTLAAENIRVIREHLLAAEIAMLSGGCPSAAAAA